jgi:phage-related protein (TIGR01555 family)
MFQRIIDKFKTPTPVKSSADKLLREGIFSTEVDWEVEKRNSLHSEINAKYFAVKATDFRPIIENTAQDNDDFIKGAFNGSWQNIPEVLLQWYSNQGFIGYQTAGILAQHWLIDKCCTMPAEDATRNGYDISANEGVEDVDPEVITAIRECDKAYEINKNLVEFLRKGKMFGIRVAIFKIRGVEPDFYLKPFNIDGIQPGSYIGISQVDPFWITPELDDKSVSDPSYEHFYEPTWYRVDGTRYHRTHLVVMRNSDLPDILKPAYFYGGIPLPQQIYERVYNSERIANEAPLLALTKRTDIIKADVAKALANDVSFLEKIQKWVFLRNNYGVKILDKDTEEFEQHDISLNDLDAVIMTQYTLVAAIARIPVTKLMGTTPKGFNSTGEYEEASYHEELKSLQTHWLSPLLERHHLLAMKSEIAPRFGIEPFVIQHVWNKLNEMTEEELAMVNKVKAETDVMYVNTGAIDGNDIRKKIVNDPESGYNMLDENDIVMPDETENDPDSFNDEILNATSTHTESGQETDSQGYAT